MTAAAGLVFLAAGGTAPETSHRVAPTPNGAPQPTRGREFAPVARALKGLFAPFNGGCTQTPSRRIALLGTFYGNAQTGAKAELDSLQKSLAQSGMRVLRFDNQDPDRIAANIERDRAEHPCDYSSRTPLIVLDGDAETRPGSDGGSRHWMRTERVTAEFPDGLAADDGVTPKRPIAGATYRVIRRTSTAKIVSALVKGVGPEVRANLILACPESARARDEFEASLRGRLSSVTVARPGKSPGLLVRLKEGAANPTDFDRNGDGTVTNLELFPKAAAEIGVAAKDEPTERPARKAVDPFSRPLPKPVDNVETEGNGFLVGLNPAPQAFDFR